MIFLYLFLLYFLFISNFDFILFLTFFNNFIINIKTVYCFLIFFFLQAKQL